MNFKNLRELWTIIKIREKLQLNEQISHPILFGVELTQSWQICAKYLHREKKFVLIAKNFSLVTK